MTQPSPPFSDSDLSAYLDGELSELERSAFEARLARDPALQAELQSLEWVSSRLRALPRVTSPVDYSRMFRPRALDAEIERRSMGRALARWSVQISAMAAALLLCAFVGWLVGRQTAPGVAVDSRELATRFPAWEDAVAQKQDRTAGEAPGFADPARLSPAVAAKSEPESPSAVAAPPALAQRDPPRAAPSETAAPAAADDAVNIVVRPEDQRAFLAAALVINEFYAEHAPAAPAGGTGAPVAPLDPTRRTALAFELPAGRALQFLDQLSGAAPKQVAYAVAGEWDRDSPLFALAHTAEPAAAPAPSPGPDLHEAAPPVLTFQMAPESGLPPPPPPREVADGPRRPLAAPGLPRGQDARRASVEDFLDPATRRELELRRLLEDMMRGQGAGPDSAPTRPTRDPANQDSADPAPAPREPATSAASPASPADSFDDGGAFQRWVFEQLRRNAAPPPASPSGPPVRINVTLEPPRRGE